MTEARQFPGKEEKPVRLADLALAKGLWPYVRPYAWMLVLTTVLVFAVTGFELLLPLLTQKAIDGFILPQGETQKILGMAFTTFQGFGLFFAAVIALGFALDFCQSLFMEFTGQKIILNLRCRLFDHMTHLPVAYFDTNPSGRLVARVAGDIENMNEMFTSILVFIFKDLALMTGIFVLLFTIHPGLALLLSLILPLIAFFIRFFSTRLRGVFRTIRQKMAEINHRFAESISGIKVLQTTLAVPPFVRAFESLNQDHHHAAMAQIRIFAVFMPLIGFLGTFSTAVIIWGGSFLVMDQKLTLGELVAFMTYMKLFFRPLRELSEKFNLLQNALASAERIITVLHTPKGDLPKTLPLALPAIHRLQFDQVNFSYNEETRVLQGICFSLERGKALGIVGQTGSGKSSIINLITGFYHPDQGRILFNGQDQTRIDIGEIRKRTALVMQDPLLFSGTVRDNITPGPLAKESALKAALEQGNCQFLFGKFSGLDTLLGEGGRPLSSGEKQLLCIARAFAFDPDLIIFDEATSYMDSQSEAKVHQAMHNLMRGRLAIIIAHRLSTVRDCDQILVLRDGKIVQQGTHDTLSAQDGEYARLLKKETIQPATGTNPWRGSSP